MPLDSFVTPILNQVSRKTKRFLIATETHEIVRIRGVLGKDGWCRDPASAKQGETEDPDTGSPLPETQGLPSEESRKKDSE